MPLLDHFHPPLTKVSGWASVHQTFLVHLASDFQDQLPRPFYAEPGVHFGIEVDVAALERMADPASNGRQATWHPTWKAPTATATVEFAVATDELEVLVYGDDPEGGTRLVGAVELVSPANKDRAESRVTFVTKVHEYLIRGVGVVVVDLVTSRHFNLHNDLMTRLGHPDQTMDGQLYAVGYRPTGKNGVGELAMWQYPVEVGEPLPTVPLWLYGGICIPARLEETYEKSVRQLRLAERLGKPRTEVIE